MNKYFALVDCNNFFVSCERIFNPKLIGKAVVVLSSNDACIIARSNEAKKLGIKMGQLFFEVKHLVAQNKVIVLSANFTLYGDISARVMQTLETLATDIEIYSVDEAFLYFPMQKNVQSDFYIQYAKYVRSKVKQNVGIPISIGIATTKTLSKLANSIAKKDPTGVYQLTEVQKVDDALKKCPIEDIWGIGSGYKNKLNKIGVTNAFQMKNLDDRWVRKNLTINGLRTVYELRGQSCLSLNDVIEEKKSICVSRAFGNNLMDINEIKQALATHVSTAAQKLRKQKMIAYNITVFVNFRNYGEHGFGFYKYSNIQLPIASSFTPTLIDGAFACIENIYRKGLIYKKVGVILDNFIDEDSMQTNTFAVKPNFEKHAKIIKTIDSINCSIGKNKVFFAACGTDKVQWDTKKNFKSPAYTTNWNEILSIKI